MARYRFLTLPLGGITQLMLNAATNALLAKAGTALQSVNGITGDSAGNVVITGTGGGGSTGTINGSFYPIFNLKDYGWTGSGTTDDWTFCKQALDAAYAAGGGIIYAGPGIINLHANTGSQLEIQPNSNAQIAFVGAGRRATTVKLSSICATFFSTSATVTGLGTVHRNLTLQGFTVDNNNMATPSGKMLGMVFCVAGFRTSLENICIKEVDVINGTRILTGNSRRGIDMTIVSTQGDATDTYWVKRIHIEDCYLGRDYTGGGDYQLIIQAWGGGNSPTLDYQGTSGNHRQYVFMDEIYLKKITALSGHDMSTVTAFIGTTNVMVGGYGYGDRLTMEDIYAEGSTDDCIELGAFDRMILKNITGKDGWSSVLYIRNIGSIQPHPGKQHIYIENLRTINQWRSSAGLYVHSTAGIPLGHVVVNGFTHEIQGALMKTSTQATAWSGGLTLRGAFKRFSLRNYAQKFFDFNFNFTANNQSFVGAAIGLEQLGGHGVIDIDGVTIEGAGTLNGGTFTGCSYSFRTIDFATGVDTNLRIRNVDVRYDFAKTGNGSYSLSLFSFGGSGSPAPSDNFDASATTINDWYTCDTANAGDVVAASGLLTSVANHTAEKRFTFLGFTIGNSQSIGPYIDGAPKMNFTYAQASGFKAGVMHRVNSTNYVEAYLTDNGTNSILNVDKIIAGTRTNIATTTLGTRVAAAQGFWIRSTLRGDTVKAEYFTTSPGSDLSTTGASVISATFTGTDVNLFGSMATNKRAGFVWVPAISTSTADSMSVVRMSVISAHISDLNVGRLPSSFFGTATGLSAANDNTIFRFRRLDVDNCDWENFAGIASIVPLSSTFTNTTTGFMDVARLNRIKYAVKPVPVSSAAAGSLTPYINKSARDELVSYTGGTVTAVEVSVDGGTTWFPSAAGTRLEPGGQIRATYSSAPTLTRIPVP